MNTLVRYRKLNHGSNVDESLFGTRTKSSSRGTGDPKSVVISANELNSIRMRAAVFNQEDADAEARARELREAKELKCRERKEHMRRLEAESSKPMFKTDIEIASTLRDQATRKAAAELIDENSDVVKLLTSLSSRAIAFTIRDKQLEEKHRRSLIEGEYDRRMDMVMELDRLKDLQKREETEAKKAIKRIDDRKIITTQMEEKSYARLLAEEAKEQENAAMRLLMSKYESEDAENGRRRQEAIEASKLEIIRANEDAIHRKLEYKERDKRDVEEALLYLALKDAELAKRERDELELESKKKENQAKLLAQQERAQNNAGKLDELRARRAEEEKERQARKKEREEALRQKQETEALLKSRAAQAQFKRERDAREKSQQEEEHRRELLFMQSQGSKEREEMDRKIAMANKHRRDLEAQIVAEEERRKMYVLRTFLQHLSSLLLLLLLIRDRSSKYENGSRNKDELRREEEKLKAIRDKMVRDLENKGVNPKYLAEMKNVDISKILKR